MHELATHDVLQQGRGGLTEARKYMHGLNNVDNNLFEFDITTQIY